MRDDLVDLLRTIDSAVLGERIRTARLRAGLTQSQVAGDAVSVGYVSRIESGQRRPDTGLMAVIADRLAVTVDELLLGVAPDRIAELRLQLDHAELALATGSPDETLEIVGRILVDPAVEDLAELRRSAGYVRASALEATGDLQEAILVLEDLAEASPPDLDWIDGLTALSRCYRESGELGRAIEVGTQGTRHIEEYELDGLDEAIRLSLTVAAAYYEQGDAAYAARLCQRAIDRAEAVASPVAKAMAYWNSSVIESMRGNASAALPMTRRALAVIEATEDARNIARLRTHLGILQLRLDPPEPQEALELLTHAADELAFTGAGPADLADNRIAQARARFLLGDVDGARRQASETATVVRSSMPILAADAFALLGQIAVHEDALDTARSHFQEAVLLLSGMGADRAAAQLWFELAGLLESVSEPAAALDAYRRAAAATGLVAPSSRRMTPATTR
ncbi:helix-turn-helix domain-containing protein [Nocardioides sp. LHG3406-4]|uniref:helix-turn-helix domain-containing protein n=1 Tax=Nocardioides sp. LHG3406-4 TaxID=2804575 RepID=UPI003CEB2FE3